LPSPLRSALAGLAFVAIAASPAFAKPLHYGATLAPPPEAKGSVASGSADILADPDTGKVSVEIEVRGITPGQLAQALVARPIGPVHFHEYRGPDDVIAVLPVPYGPAYRATPTGFHVSLPAIPYAETAKLMGSGLTFADFTAALAAGKILLNIHTDRFPDGEINGKLVPRP